MNKYLHTVASGWILLTLNCDAQNHELKKKKPLAVYTVLRHLIMDSRSVQVLYQNKFEK